MLGPCRGLLHQMAESIDRVRTACFLETQPGSWPYSALARPGGRHSVMSAPEYSPACVTGVGMYAGLLVGLLRMAAAHGPRYQPDTGLMGRLYGRACENLTPDGQPTMVWLARCRRDADMEYGFANFVRKHLRGRSPEDSPSRAPGGRARCTRYRDPKRAYYYRL
jgi:hypothetical protein